MAKKTMKHPEENQRKTCRSTMSKERILRRVWLAAGKLLHRYQWFRHGVAKPVARAQRMEWEEELPEARNKTIK